MKTWSKRIIEMTDYCIALDSGMFTGSTLEFWPDEGLKFNGAQVWLCKCTRTTSEDYSVGGGFHRVRTNVDVLTVEYVPGAKGFDGAVVLNGVTVKLSGKRLQDIQDKLAEHQFMSKLNENLA
jgi:hypothetical protein